MDDPENKEQVLEYIHSAREELESVIDQLDEARMLEPMDPDGWTVKDVLAHLTVWEQRMIQWTEESLSGEIPQRPAPGMTWNDLDRLNELTYRTNKDRPLADVLRDFKASFQQTLETVERLSQEDLFNPKRFAYRQGDPLWHMVAANTWWHYREHADALRAHFHIS